MKQFCLFVTVLLLSFSGITAQITITSADMPNVGDTLRFSEASAISVLGQNFSATGANYSWDFSTLVPSNQIVDTFVAVTSTPIYYYPSFITNATYARKGEEVAMASFSLTNVFDFFKEATGYYAQVGFAAQLSGIPLPTLYTSPDYLFRFPLAYGNSDSCQFGSTITIPTLFTYNNQSKRVNTVDGWGTLTTPFGTFQTLRVKSELTSRDSIASDSLPFPIPPTTTVTTEYKWLASGHHEPILTATTGALGATTVVYRDVFRDLTASVSKPATRNSEIIVSPNPALNQVRLSAIPDSGNAELEYQILDLSGKIVLRGSAQVAAGSCTLDITALQSGVYILHLHDGARLSATTRLVKI